jgi:hypothetical protein
MSSELSLLLLVALLFAVFFPLLWCGVCALLALVGGWWRLGRRYASEEPPRGTPYLSLHGTVGVVSYRGCLHAHVAPEGLYLSVPWPFRVGHQPLRVPWTDIHDVRERQWMWARIVSFAVGAPRLARVRLPAEVFAALPEAARHAVAGASIDPPTVS